MRWVLARDPKFEHRRWNLWQIYLGQVLTFALCGHLYVLETISWWLCISYSDSHTYASWAWNMHLFLKLCLIRIHSINWRQAKTFDGCFWIQQCLPRIWNISLSGGKNAAQNINKKMWKWRWKANSRYVCSNPWTMSIMGLRDASTSKNSSLLNCF